MSTVPRSTPPRPECPIMGQSEPILRALERAERFATSSLPVLLVGATGTGKELFARYIHQLSGRSGDFIDINCGALPRDMVESLLFGHRRGAFTGAIEDTVGLVTHASGGSLFLDELGSMPPEGQAKLLRFLENGDVRRLGESRNRRVEARLVAAVQEDIGVRLERGEFREDLYHRVCGVIIHLPALRDRPGDPCLLASHFSARHGRVLGMGAVAVLEQHHWPGNVRELRSVIERAVRLTEQPEIDARCLVEAIDGGPARWKNRAAATSAERDRAELLAVSAANGWDVNRIAASLGVSRATLYRRLKASSIELRRLGKSHRSQESHTA